MVTRLSWIELISGTHKRKPRGKQMMTWNGKPRGKDDDPSCDVCGTKWIKSHQTHSLPLIKRLHYYYCLAPPSPHFSFFSLNKWIFILKYIFENSYYTDILQYVIIGTEIVIMTLTRDFLVKSSKFITNDFGKLSWTHINFVKLSLHISLC